MARITQMIFISNQIYIYCDTFDGGLGLKVFVSMNMFRNQTKF